MSDSTGPVRVGVASAYVPAVRVSVCLSFSILDEAAQTRAARLLCGITRTDYTTVSELVHKLR